MGSFRSRRPGARRLAATCLAAALLAPLSLRSAPSHAGAEAARVAQRRPPGASRPGPLPDSVLARVGATRRVTVSDFRRSWRALEPPQRPDSLTPASAREFLDLLISKEALGERAAGQPWVWTRRESLLAASLRDQMMLRAALAPHLARARDSLLRAGLPADEGSAGVAARQRFLAASRPQFDDSLLARLAAAFRALPRPSADSGLFAQLRVLGALPAVGAADSLRVLARTPAGPYRTAEFLAWWRNVTPVARPRVEGADDMRQLVGNALFETALRREAERDRLERRPEIAAAEARQREGFAVDHFIAREVYDSLPGDSATLRRFFDRDPSRWGLPQRVRVVRLELPTRAEAERMGARLRDRAEVETLIGEKLPDAPLPNEARPPRARFVVDLTEADQPEAYRAAIHAGAGAVIGPDSSARGWAVARVVQVIPARLRSFEEARAFVAHDWDQEEGERRMRALFARVRRGLRIVVNERALRALTAAEAGAQR